MSEEKDFEQEKRGWIETLQALKDDFTLSIRDVCGMLKVSRGWVNKYIKPHVESLYLNSGRRGEYRSGTNWVYIAARVLGRAEMTESVWFHKKQLMDLLACSVVSVTKQTKRVPLVYLIEPEKREAYVAERDELRDRLDKTTNFSVSCKLIAELSELYKKYMNKDEIAIAEQHCSVTARGAVERIDVNYPGEFDPKKWVAAHDLKDYGDTDEDVYRMLFKNGYIRIEINIPSADGKESNKIYYIQDPESIKEEWDDRLLIIPETVWQEYLKKKAGV